uniref:Prolyl 4-hydroxylase alpha subunit Fe(2+) 2OG dioxygenase domain-containing protein n=2 Tax=Brassica oleracea TaxID=3712 RepID=A0A0D3C5Y3_BRAOL
MSFKGHFLGDWTSELTLKETQFSSGAWFGLDGQSDPKSIHGGCEVLSGEKWSATKWMRKKSYFFFQ